MGAREGAPLLVLAIEGAKTAETRQRRIASTVAKLRAGESNPLDQTAAAVFAASSALFLTTSTRSTRRPSIAITRNW